MMGVTGASLSLCVFLCLMPMCPADNLPTSDMSTTIGTSQTISTSQTIGTGQTAIFEEKDNNTTLAECLIDNQMGLIAIGSAGGLIVFLLVAVVTLACQVYRLQTRVYITRSSRSNLDLVGNAGYWANAAAGTGCVGGLVGPCDNSVMLEEVKTQDEEGDETHELGDISEERFEEEGAQASGLSPEEKPLMQSSTSRESYPEVPHDLENMPLVV